MATKTFESAVVEKPAAETSDDLHDLILAVENVRDASGSGFPLRIGKSAKIAEDAYCGRFDIDVVSKPYWLDMGGWKLWVRMTTEQIAKISSILAEGLLPETTAANGTETETNSTPTPTETQTSNDARTSAKKTNCYRVRKVHPDIVPLSNSQVEEIGDLLFDGYEAKTRTSVVGLFNRGKSFLLGLLVGTDSFPSGIKVHTQGLCWATFDGEGTGILAIDSPGTNTRLDRAMLEIERQHFTVFTPVSTPPSSGMNHAQLEEAEGKYEMEMARYHDKLRKTAIIDKKATESYLQQVIFNMSDVFIIVVNQMTWSDQQYIESIYLSLDHSRGQSIVVVHNFKEVSDMNSFQELMKEYVLDVYYGKVYNKKVRGNSSAVVFQETGKNLQHVFLCQDGSDAGNAINPNTIDYLRTFAVNHEQSFRGKKFFPNLLRTCQSVMADVMKKPGELSIYWNKVTHEFQVLSNLEETSFIRADLQVTDCAMVMHSLDFTIRIDTIEEPNGFTIRCDVPGFDPKKVESFGCKLEWELDCDANSLILFGHRSLYAKKFEPGRKEFAPMVSFYSDADYDNASIRVERNYGEFRREIVIPRKYQIPVDDNLHYEMVNGELTFFFPPKAKRTRISLGGNKK